MNAVSAPMPAPVAGVPPSAPTEAGPVAVGFGELIAGLLGPGTPGTETSVAEPVGEVPAEDQQPDATEPEAAEQPTDDLESPGLPPEGPIPTYAPVLPQPPSVAAPGAAGEGNQQVPSPTAGPQAGSVPTLATTVQPGPDQAHATGDGTSGEPVTPAGPGRPAAPETGAHAQAGADSAPAPAPGPTAASEPAPPPSLPLSAAAPATVPSSDLPAGLSIAGRQVGPTLMRILESPATGPTTHRLTLQLHPVDLGEVRATLTLRDGTVRVSLAAGPEARELLRRDHTLLHHILEQTGAERVEIAVRTLPGGREAADLGRTAPTPGDRPADAGSTTAGSPGDRGDPGTGQRRPGEAHATPRAGPSLLDLSAPEPTSSPPIQPTAAGVDITV